MSGTKGIHIKPSEGIERDPADVYRDINEAWVTLEDLYQELGRSMSEARRERNMAQVDVAGLIGISRDMVCLAELGRRWKRDMPYLEKMALLLSKTSGSCGLPLASGE